MAYNGIDKRQKAKAEQERRHIEEVKKLTGRPPKYTSAVALAFKMAEYFYLQDKQVNKDGKSRPYTMSGLQLHVGLAKDLYSDYANGKHDDACAKYTAIDQEGNIRPANLLDKDIDIINTYRTREELKPYFNCITNGYNADEPENTILFFSDCCKNAKQFIAVQDEERLKAQGRVADIFIMKSCHNWQEENNKTITHKIEIATEAESLQALKELQLLDE